MPVRENPARVGPGPRAPATAAHSTPPVPAVPGVLTAADILATGNSIAAVQEPIGRHRLARRPHRRVEPRRVRDGAVRLRPARRGPARLRVAPRQPAGRRVVAEEDSRRPAWSPTRPPRATRSPTSRSVSGTSFWSRGTRRSRRGCGPRCGGAIGFVLGLQTPRGEIAWEREADGSPARYALLTGCSSIYQSLRCAVALAEFVGRAAARLGARGRPARARGREPPRGFADKSRFSMDWYYPVLAGPVRGPAAAARLAASWAASWSRASASAASATSPGSPARRPASWCSHWTRSATAAGRWSCSATFSTCGTPDGGYWTGWQFVNQAHFPAEHSSWTAAAMILAADALAGATGGAGLFRTAGAGRAALPPADADACGCALPAPG